ncbi:Phospholipid-transporting ATPase IK [Saguinus oedipus]|uniref:Phospholipid-transporting ATPase IK n=1 Tax=Saguinus oedipus TaxID=9490 RepID=A0ABQ9TR79_SAGOE|nr:Phospholipid-transporting ATPase IK [Saguinus oedipus]
MSSLKVSPTSMGSLGQREELQDEDKNSGADPGEGGAAFTWEVQANSRAYNSKLKEKVLLCWRRKKHKTNVIRTAKYNFFSFLPLNLYEQFHHHSTLSAPLGFLLGRAGCREAQLFPSLYGLGHTAPLAPAL